MCTVRLPLKSKASGQKGQRRPEAKKESRPTWKCKHKHTIVYFYLPTQPNHEHFYVACNMYKFSNGFLTSLDDVEESSRLRFDLFSWWSHFLSVSKSEASLAHITTKWLLAGVRHNEILSKMKLRFANIFLLKLLDSFLFQRGHLHDCCSFWAFSIFFSHIYANVHTSSTQHMCGEGGTLCLQSLITCVRYI